MGEEQPLCHPWKSAPREEVEKVPSPWTWSSNNKLEAFSSLLALRDKAQLPSWKLEQEKKLEFPAGGAAEQGWMQLGRAGQDCGIFPQDLFVGSWSQPGWMVLRLTQELHSTSGRKIHMINMEGNVLNTKGNIKPHNFHNINLIFTTININRSEMESLQSRCKPLQAACAGAGTPTSY